MPEMKKEIKLEEFSQTPKEFEKDVQILNNTSEIFSDIKDKKIQSNNNQESIFESTRQIKGNKEEQNDLVSGVNGATTGTNSNRFSAVTRNEGLAKTFETGRLTIPLENQQMR